MKNKKLYLILAVGLVMMSAAVLVYRVSDLIPGVSNLYMAADATGVNQTTVFSPSDPIYAFFHVKGIKAGTKFQSCWYALDLDGHDPNTAFHAIEYAYTGKERQLYFELVPVMNLPAGNYKVEIYMNDAKVGERTFSVQ